MLRAILAGTAVAILTATATLAAPAGEGPQSSFDVMVGDAAPALNVGEWVKGTPVATFEPGVTYVVEFWATWCGPCKKAIPHMSELQEQYDRKMKGKVRFVGVSIWEQAPTLVAPFVEKMGAKMSYTVAMDQVVEDDDGEKTGAMATTWMKAAGQSGIPTAFIVDGQGRVAWIGSPFYVDEPLRKIAKGEWDLAAAAEKHCKKMAVKAYSQNIAGRVKKATRGGEWAAAVATIDEAIMLYPELEKELGVQKFMGLMHSNLKLASAYGEHIFANVYHDEAGALNWIAWTIVDPEVDFAWRDLPLAIKISKRANELTKWKDAAILDTYALALFGAGERVKAIEIQEKAVKFSIGTRYEKELKSRLEEFKKAVQTQG